jgi:hypothetical protein
MGRSLLIAFLLMIGIGASSAGVAEPTLVRLEAVGTVFHATFGDGSVKKGRDLVGMVLTFSKNGVPVRIRISAINPDPSDKTGSVFLHDFRFVDTGEPICGPAPDGQRTVSRWPAERRRTIALCPAVRTTSSSSVPLGRSANACGLATIPGRPSPTGI